MNRGSEATFLDVLDDVFFVFDESGTPIEWNQAVVSVTGYSPTEVEGMAPADFFEGEAAKRIETAISAVLETGEATVEADILTADGRHIPYEFKARRLILDGGPAIAGIGRDISERIERREQIERRERILRDMYEIIADRTLGFVEQVEALLDLGREELDIEYGTLSKIVGDEYVFEVVHADDDSIQRGDVVPLSATNCEIAASTEQMLVLGDIARDAPDQTGRAGYAEWGISCYIGAPVYVGDDVYGTFCFYDREPRAGQFSEWEVTLVDLMSRWVSSELHRKQSNDRLQRQNERLERFASIVSHDLRNPLNVVAGSISLAEETGDLEQLARAQRAVERMDTLIEDLLTLARSGEAIAELEAVELATFVRTCWENVQTLDATLSVESERIVRADETRLQQLLENLIRNAIEHGGSAVEITIGDLPDGFYVADNGTGIPEADREEVFESGYTTIERGTGFGLAIVTEIATAHDWTVTLTESETGGARFEFTGVTG